METKILVKNSIIFSIENASLQESKNKKFGQIIDSFIIDFVEKVEPNKPFLKLLTNNLNNKFNIQYVKHHKLYCDIVYIIVIQLREKYPLIKDLCPFREETILEDILNIENIDISLKKDVEKHFNFFKNETKENIFFKYNNKNDMSKLIYSFVLNLYWFKQFSKELKDFEKDKTKLFGVLGLLTEGYEKCTYLLGSKNSEIVNLLKPLFYILIGSKKETRNRSIFVKRQTKIKNKKKLLYDSTKKDVSEKTYSKPLINKELSESDNIIELAAKSLLLLKSYS